jgi:ABC-type lipoprotein export system ATPase subunit
MAQHLVTTGETAPLILDEVTAQADDTRRDALLGVLHELSLERQVILFTHDPRIGEWASRHLDPARDIVIPLAGRPAAAS